MSRNRLLTVLSILLVLGFLSFAAAAKEESAQASMSNSDCLSCHNDSKLTKDVNGKAVSVYVDQATFGSSIHGSLGCTDCHTDVKEAPHEKAPQKVNCATCHSDATDAYNHGIHAKAVREGHSMAAGCLDCHGNAHAIVSKDDVNSRVNRANIPKTCGSCHGVKFVMAEVGMSAQPFLSYQQSVHGKAVQSGLTIAAVCTDCHGSHDIRTPADPASPIFKFNVPNTCGRCHQPIAAQFVQSIHGKALSRGNWQAPVCTDCHGIHNIKPAQDPASSVAPQHIALTTCAHCHEGVILTQEFGVSSNRVSSYMESYHGLASQLGSNVVANCASCHGVHNILPSSDPRSIINRNNLAKTCGKCHPGAGINFVKGKIHTGAAAAASFDIGSQASRYVRSVYIWLIVLVIGGMILHNALIWVKKLQRNKRQHDRPIVRLPYHRRIQHLLLLSSFTVLAITGFALKYPDSWLGVLLHSENIRRITHRVAAVVFLIEGIYHFVYVLFTPSGREFLKRALPVKKDITDFAQNILYFLGLRSARPQFSHYSYAEKAEYWAAVWGIIIMGLTGLIVWFKVAASRFMPLWMIDVAIAIHFYEAILATLAILVWHFYNVIFDPDIYPMNWAWWDGRVSEEQFRHEHPLAAKELTQSEKKGEEKPILRPAQPKPSEG